MATFIMHRTSGDLGRAVDILDRSSKRLAGGRPELHFVPAGTLADSARNFVLTSAGPASQMRVCLRAPLPRFGAAGVNSELGGRGAATPLTDFANRQDYRAAFAFLASPSPSKAILIGCDPSRWKR